MKFTPILIVIILSGDIFPMGNQVQPVSGLRENPPRVWAMTNCTIFTEPGEPLENGIVVIRDGFIENVGKDITIPADAAHVDLQGATVYPGFIESWLPVSTKKGVISHPRKHWNIKVNSSLKTTDYFNSDSDDLESLHKLGFTSAHIVADTGIFRGQSALVQLDKTNTVLRSSVAQTIAYEVDGWGSDNYPNSLLGVIALIRQTLLDGDWYGNAKAISEKYPNKNEPFREDLDLQSLSHSLQSKQPFIFETGDEIYALRSNVLADEFKLNYWLKGNGLEYRRLDELKQSNPFIILPVDFPKKPNVNNHYQALSYSTAHLKHWDMAPDNPATLADNKMDFSLTSADLKEKNQFRKNLIRAVKRGLSETDALKALTTTPAKYFGVDDILGKIKPGYIANLTIVDGSFFNKHDPVTSVWVGGEEIQQVSGLQQDFTGEWEFRWEETSGNMKISKHFEKLRGQLYIDSLDRSLEDLEEEGSKIHWKIKLTEDDIVYRFTGYLDENQISGNVFDISGSSQEWSAVRIRTGETQVDDIQENRSELTVVYPEGAYGIEKPLTPTGNILVKNATIWTCSNQGVLDYYDILFSNGKISKIGQNLKTPKNAIIIDGTGKHITPGLIDCHSHSAALSINEGTQSITAEVRIQDVLNSDDIAIYRELAGGLTCANILHGSANTIGGQNAVVKLRWGVEPDQLLFKDAPQGIKFALGENVKQSNWGDDNTTRYPQTRMGVEQLFRDAFTTAREYQNEWEDFNKNKRKWKKKVPPRRDLELDALVEILEGDRLVHCHSYRQDEILMLTRIADDFGFTIGTFQHVLEGYKVAERLAEHGAGASTFSDWWAYKYEVIDAIPYNGALMDNVGVNVSFNSDSNELARRMNTEAAKAVKYGGISEEDALNFVTINPARQLQIDKWVGSLEVGKDADFVIWSDHPLSTNAVCEQTWIEGIQYFSLKQDQAYRERDKKIRNGLIQKILSTKKEKKKSEEDDEDEKEWDESPHIFHCIEVDYE